LCAQPFGWLTFVEVSRTLLVLKAGVQKPSGGWTLTAAVAEVEQEEQSFTTVMDNGANLLLEGVEQSTDWRGEFTGCDSWQERGVCELYGFFTVDQDPFEEGIFLGPIDELPGVEATSRVSGRGDYRAR